MIRSFNPAEIKTELLQAASTPTATNRVVRFGRLRFASSKVAVEFLTRKKSQSLRNRFRNRSALLCCWFLSSIYTEATIVSIRPNKLYRRYVMIHNSCIIDSNILLLLR